MLPLEMIPGKPSEDGLYVCKADTDGELHYIFAKVEKGEITKTLPKNLPETLIVSHRELPELGHGQGL